MASFDPRTLAQRQIELDRANIAHPSAQERKRERLSGSPHGFLRGSAALFYEMLAARPELAEGPPGEGWIAGDMHLENVGAYRTDDDEVVFDLNDFDDAIIGPWRLDVLRVSTSVLLAGPSFGATGPDALTLAETLISAHASAAFEGARAKPEASPAIADLIARCKARKREDLVNEIAEEKGGRYRFKRNKRTWDTTPALASAIPSLFAAYVEALGARAPAHTKKWRFEDAAEHLAGNGSLGKLRVWALFNDDGAPRFLELKEESTPAPCKLLGPTPFEGSERVARAAQNMLARPTFRMAALRRTDTTPCFLARRLVPDEDKLDLSTMHMGSKLTELVTIVGRLLGQAHRRAATAPPPAAWTADDRARILDHAIELAGLHQAIHLWYSRLIGASLPPSA
jgi:uncharacterized protein (DUF2252 family)